MTESEVKLQPFAVFSASSDGDSYEDWLMAKDEDDAMTQVAAVRDGQCTVSHATTFADRIKSIKRLLEMAQSMNNETIQSEWKETVKCFAFKLCCKCGELIREPVLTDGEDEKCEKCADPE